MKFDLLQYRFNSRLLSDEVRKEVFSKRNNFANQVLLSPKSSAEMVLYEVDSFDEAYVSSAEVLNVILSHLQMMNPRRFETNSMQYKLRVMVHKEDSKYKVVAKYR